MLKVPRRKPAAHRARKGFSLLEIMAALLIMALAIVVFGASYPAASQAMAKSRGSDWASDACQKQLDIYRNASYYSLIRLVPENAQSATTSFTVPSELPSGTGTAKFTLVDENFNATTTRTGRLRVDVTVSWQGAGSNKSSVVLTTLVTG